MPRDGFLNLLKPPGMTSHDAVAFVRSRLRTRRVGHLGTLDPAAAGVLPLAIGRATRLADYSSGESKAYRAEVTFGLSTDTLDAGGSITAVGDSSALSRLHLLELLERFSGEIEQTPPAHSAVQVEGKRMHQMARRGQAPAIKPKTVRIDMIALVGFWPGRRAHALLDVVCGPGTYIRSLAVDLGRAAGCDAYLSFLVRTRVGRFELAQTSTLEECQSACDRGEPGSLMLPPDWPLLRLPAVELDTAASRRFSQGTPVPTGAQPVELVRVYRSSDTGQLRTYRTAVADEPVGESVTRRFLGLGAIADGHLRPRVVVSGDGEEEE